MAQGGFGIAGAGTCLPRATISAAELDRLTAQPPGSTAARFGVTLRHRADPDETSSAMAAYAACRALDDAGWRGDSLDVIISACGVMEQPIPGTAALVQRRLGLGASGIPAFDVNATCLSFLIAFDRVLAGFALGEWRRALIVSADIASAALDYADPEASVLFGDGAAAIALEADGPHRRLANAFCTYGDGADLCRLEAGGTRLRPDDDLETFLTHARFRMDGPGLFRATARRFPGFLHDLLSRAGVAADQLDCVLPHQASRAALEHLKRAIPDGEAKTIDLFASVGNLIATSIPFTLATARAQGRLRTGELGLVIGTSAGVSLGGAVIRW
ncbi:3-oxoacyl-[acyl-carrier-protein] synthase III C-terminal domain-containing protein [Sphingomonas sp. PB4P5]|uniref:3-oxoacyl-[acyl-carrier-protein] synthase III C-terminal domain-containing protein n=1 Tax=Parasphingomonas puruogangriensis TaxID=3096155 RepID=UPI002FC7D19A